MKNPLAIFAATLLLATAAVPGLSRASLQAGANLGPYEVKNTATGKEYCQMCAYSSKPATVAAYGKLNDEAFWADLKKLQAYQDRYPEAGFFAQVLDSTDAKAIAAKAKANGITFPVVYATDKDWNDLYKVDTSRTVYVSKKFRVVYSTIGLDDKPNAELGNPVAQ